MANWQSFVIEAPELAGASAAAFGAHLHHILATLRADGSPRVSGTEAHVVGGELWLGMMPGSAKLADVLRDPRIALHAAPLDVTMATGDVKVSGRVVVPSDTSAFLDFLRNRSEGEPPTGSMFAVDLSEVVRTTVSTDELVVETWRPGRGVLAVRRS